MEFQTKAWYKWGVFRKFISKHPLTGFWIGVVSGGVVGAIVAYWFW